MQAEIDMSGRIEETSRYTVIAMANKNFSARSNTEIRVLIFTDLLIHLIKPHLKKIDSIIIDTEYTGYEPVIKNRVLSLLPSPIYISFDQVGKESPSHLLALDKFRRLQFPNRYPKQKPGSSKKK